MRLNLTRQELGDFLIMILFDRSFDDSFIDHNENFTELMNQLIQRGLQTSVFEYYFEVDPQLRTLYNQWRSAYDTENRRTSIEIHPDIVEEKQTEQDFYRELITEVVKKAVDKENPNPEKLKQLQDEILELYELKG